MGQDEQAGSPKHQNPSDIIATVGFIAGFSVAMAILCVIMSAAIYYYRTNFIACFHFISACAGCGKGSEKEGEGDGKKTINSRKQQSNTNNEKQQKEQDEGVSSDSNSNSKFSFSPTDAYNRPPSPFSYAPRVTQIIQNQKKGKG